MPNRSGALPADSISFGRFRLFPRQLLLLEDDKPLRLGSRALHILNVLVERPGEIVSKDDLIAEVWPTTFVDEGNLRVHMSALRRALGDGHAGSRYITNITGRGYKFVAPIARAEATDLVPPKPDAPEPSRNLPAPLTRTVGRADIVRAVSAQLARRRFVTLVGPGGMGKTTVALAVANALAGTYQDAAAFVDLSPLADGRLVPGVVASALGAPVGPIDPVPGLIGFLRERRMLIVLDSCEHVIGAAAALAEEIFREAPDVHILATSREPLRAEGELVHPLPPLDIPPSSAGLTAAEALTFPAVQLFVERATASLDGFELSDADASVVADICRRLDGIALAIELAAGRVETFGVRGVAKQLSDRFRLLTRGARTALPRHRTLSATLGWSYDFLPDIERLVLRRLAIFAGGFTAPSANAVAGDADVPAACVDESVANLVEKSLIAAQVGDDAVYYRLLDSTRAYALGRLTESGELNQIARRHAEHHRHLFERLVSETDTETSGDWLGTYRHRIDDVRAALDWAASSGGDMSIGVALIVATVPLWMHLSLLEECRTWVDRALGSLGPQPVDGSSSEMLLKAALGMSLMYTRGPISESRETWARVLHIATRVGNLEYQLRALYGLWLHEVLVRDFRAAQATATQFHRVAEQAGADADVALSGRMIGMALHYLGDQPNARVCIDRGVGAPIRADRRWHTMRYGLDQHVAALTQQSRILWLQGLPDQAWRVAQVSVDEAMQVDHGNSLCLALADGAGLIALWRDDVLSTERFVEMLNDSAEKYALGVWRTYGHALRGRLLARTGSPADGVALLRSALADLQQMPFDIRYPLYLMWLAEALGALGQFGSALVRIDDVLDRAGRAEERWVLPELLRIKGEFLLQEAAPDASSAAEQLFLQGLHWAQRQGSLAWELRCATSLAGLRVNQGRHHEARAVLAPVYGQFSEGFYSGDLRAAQRLLDDAA